MFKVTPEVRPRTARGARVSTWTALRAATALTLLSCAPAVFAAPLRADRDHAAAGSQYASIDFSALPSVVGTEYLRRGFDNAALRAVFVLKPVKLTELIGSVDADVEAPRTTALAPEEVTIRGVTVSSSVLRSPREDLESFYDSTLRADPPPAPSDRNALAGTLGGRDLSIERDGKTLDEYLNTPEPATIVLALGGAVWLLRRRRG